MDTYETRFFCITRPHMLQISCQATYILSSFYISFDRAIDDFPILHISDKYACIVTTFHFLPSCHLDGKISNGTFVGGRKFGE